MNTAATTPTGITALTVSQITAQIKNVLEGEFRNIWVLGEVSKVNLHRSGHLYLDLKDARAIVHVVMWRTEVQKLSALPEAGTEVFVHGRVTLYEPQGNYQLNIDQIHPKGLGAQDLALRRLKERLQRLGYFAAQRKRPLPRFPRRIALMASPSGAAIRDMLEVLRSALAGGGSPGAERRRAGSGSARQHRDGLCAAQSRQRRRCRHPRPRRRFQRRPVGVQ